MIDWKKIYLNEVAPVITNFTAPPPLIVLGIMALVFLGGIALLIWAPGKFKGAGAVLVFIVSFVAYMVLSNHYKARNRSAHIESGIVTKLYSKKGIKTDAQGIQSPTITYFLELDVSQAYPLTEEGAGKVMAGYGGKENFVVSKTLQMRMREGELIHAVIMPTAKKAIHFAVLPDGEVVK